MDESAYRKFFMRNASHTLFDLLGVRVDRITTGGRGTASSAQPERQRNNGEGCKTGDSSACG